MSHEPEYGPGELPGMWEESDLSGGLADAEDARPGAWARLVYSQPGDNEFLELCNEALKEVQAETERRLKHKNVVLPTRGRFLVQDGMAFRVQSQWIETRNSELIRMGVVIYKESL